MSIVANHAKLPMVQGGLVRPALEYANRNGADCQRLLRRARLPGDLIAQPRHFVPAENCFFLLADLVRESGRTELGWDLAFLDPFRSYSHELIQGIFGAPTLLEGLRFLTRFQSRHSNCQELRVRVIGEFAYVFHADNWHYPGYEQRSALRTASLILAVRAFAGERWRPDLIVTNTALDVFPECDLLSSTRLVRRPRYAAIRVPRNALIAQARHHYDGSYAAGAGLAGDTVGQIRQVLSSYAHEQMPTLEGLAEMMHTSTRSLQRRLRSLDTSYSNLIQEANFNTARELLNDSARPITDIAHALGYDDASHFSRFFRRMGGVTPSEYRHATIIEPTRDALIRHKAA